MNNLPPALTRDQEFMAAMVDRLDAILDRLPATPAKADAGGPVEVREPAKKAAPAKKTTARARQR